MALAVMTGCGGSGSSATAPTNLETATDVADMLKEFSEAKKGGPANLLDLDKIDASAVHPVAHGAIARQDFIVFWKVAINPANAETVIAYDKEAPIKGGAVVMGDGSVKNLTVDEFNAAKKAGTVKK
jgi:hypothetical protein